MNRELSNFDQIEKSLLDNFLKNKLHHGLLFSGNKGIGKAKFAFDIATKFLLSSSLQPDEDLKKIQSGSHPDLLIIKKEEEKRDISIDAVREIIQFLNLTAAISKHRIIIIDAIDDLNRSSNNAILKTLEEPSKNVFLFLISHNSTKILDTIKSRCHLIKISNPTDQNFQRHLKEIIGGISEEEIEILSKISNNSFGTAIEMHQHNVIDIHHQIRNLIIENNQKAIVDLAKIIAKDENLWGIFEKLIIFYFYNLISCESLDYKAFEAKQNFMIFDKVSALFLATKNLNLDKSQSVINIFNIIKNGQLAN